MIHGLKILPEYFEEVLNRNKTFEIRRNDRDFKVGDKIILKKYTKKNKYSGDYAKGEIIFITDYQQKDGYIVFGFRLESSGYNINFTKEEK